MRAEATRRHPWTLAWASCSIAQIGVIYGGGTPRRELAGYWNGSIPWVTPGELSTNRAMYLTAARESITDRGLRSSSAKLVPKDSLLVTTRASLGLVALAGMPLATNQGFRTVVFDDPRDAHFYYHFAARLKGELERRASGTTFLEISGREFAAITVPSPTRAEKDRIAEILDTVDDVIQQTERVIAKLEQMKAGMLYDLLTRGIDDNGEVRDPERHPEQFKDSPLGRIPKHWRTTTLGECTTCLSGFAFSSSGFNDESGLRLVRIRDLLGGEVEVTYFRGTFEDRYLVQDGDLLVGMDGDFNAVEWAGGRALLNQRVCRLAPKLGSGLDLRFLRHILQPILHSIHRVTPQTTVRHLAMKTLVTFPMVLPPHLEQLSIAKRLDQHESRSRQEIMALGKLRATKRALADDLLTGRVRVNTQEAVPA